MKRSASPQSQFTKLRFVSLDPAEAVGQSRRVETGRFVHRIIKAGRLRADRHPRAVTIRSPQSLAHRWVSLKPDRSKAPGVKKQPAARHDSLQSSRRRSRRNWPLRNESGVCSSAHGAQALCPLLPPGESRKRLPLISTSAARRNGYRSVTVADTTTGGRTRIMSRESQRYTLRRRHNGQSKGGDVSCALKGLGQLLTSMREIEQHPDARLGAEWRSYRLEFFFF